MEDIIKNEFNFYFKFTKPLVLNLSEPNERILAASWLKKLTHEDIGSDNLRTDYLKLLLFTLQRRKLVGIFGDSPDKYEQLEPFPEDITLGTIAKHLLEEEKKERLERIRKELSGEKGDSPLFTTDYSEDLLEYVAAQDIPNFGVHAFYAFSKETLPHWQHADKAIFPKIAKSAVSTNLKEPSPLAEPTVLPEAAAGAPQITEAPIPPEPASATPQEDELEGQPPGEPEGAPAAEEIPAPAEGGAPSPKVVTTSTPERRRTPKRRSISPPIKPLGVISPKDTEDRKPPNWGSNLLEVRESPKQHKDFEDFLHYSFEWPDEERSAFFLDETPSFLDDTPESIPSYMQKHLDRAASLPYRTPPMRGRAFGEDLSGLKSPSMRGRDFEDLSGLRTPSMRGRSFGEDLSGLRTPSMRGRSFGEDLSGLRTPSPRGRPTISASSSIEDLEKELDEIDAMIKNFGDVEEGDMNIDLGDIDDDLEQKEFEELEKEDKAIDEELNTFDILIRQMEKEALEDLEAYEESTKLTVAQEEEQLEARKRLDNMNKLMENLYKELEDASVGTAGVPATTPKRSNAPKRPKKKIDLSTPKEKEKKIVTSSKSDAKDEEMAKMFDKGVKKVSPQPSTSGLQKPGSKIPGIGRGIGRGIPVAGGSSGIPTGRGIPRGIPTARGRPSGIPSASGIPRPGAAPPPIPRPTVSAPLASSTARPEEIQPGEVKPPPPSGIPSTSRLRKPSGLKRPKPIGKAPQQQVAVPEEAAAVVQQVPLPTSSPPSQQAAPIIQEAVEELQPKTIAEEAMPFEELFPQMKRHYGQEEFFNLEDEPYFLDEYFSAEEVSGAEEQEHLQDLHFQSPPNFDDEFLDFEPEDQLAPAISPPELKTPGFLLEAHDLLPEVLTIEQIEMQEKRANETVTKKETTTVRQVSPAPVQEVVKKTEQENVFDIINQQLLELEQEEVSVTPTTPSGTASRFRIESPPSVGQRLTYTPERMAKIPTPPQVQFEFEPPPVSQPQYIPIASISQFQPTDGIDNVAYELPPDDLMYGADEDLDYLDDEMIFEGDGIFDEPMNILETSPTMYPESPEEIPEGVQYSPPLAAVLQQHQIPEAFHDQSRPQMQKYVLISGRPKRLQRHSQPAAQLSPVDEHMEDILDLGFAEEVSPVTQTSPYRTPPQRARVSARPQITREEEYYIRYHVPEELQEVVRMRTLASKLVSGDEGFPQEEFVLPRIPYIDVSPPPLARAPTPSPPKLPPPPQPPQLLQVPTVSVEEITPGPPQSAAQPSVAAKGPSKLPKTKSKTKAGEARSIRKEMYPQDKWTMRQVPPHIQERIEKSKEYSKQLKLKKSGSKIAVKVGSKVGKPAKEAQPPVPAPPPPVPQQVPEPIPEPPRPPLSPPNIQIPEDFNYLQASPPPEFYSPSQEEDDMFALPIDAAADGLDMLDELPPQETREILSPETPSPDKLLFPIDVLVSLAPRMMTTYRRRIGKRIVERHSQPPELDVILEGGPRTRRELAAQARTQQSAYANELAQAETPRARQPAATRRRQRRLAKPIPKRRIDFGQFSGEELEPVQSYIKNLEERFDLPPLPADLTPGRQEQLNLLDAPIAEYIEQAPIQPPPQLPGWRTPPKLKQPSPSPQKPFAFVPKMKSPVVTGLDEEMPPELMYSPGGYEPPSPPIDGQPSPRIISPVVTGLDEEELPQELMYSPEEYEEPSPLAGQQFVQPRWPSPVAQRAPTPVQRPKQPSPIPGPSWRRTPTPELVKITPPPQRTPESNAIETVQTNVEAVYDNPEDFITPPRLIRHMSRVRKVMTETSPVVEVPDLPQIEDFAGFEGIEAPEYYSPERTPPSPMSTDEAFQEMYQRVQEAPGVIPMGPMYLRYYGGRTNRPMPRSYRMLKHRFLPRIPHSDAGEKRKTPPPQYGLPEVQKIAPQFEEYRPSERLFAVQKRRLDESKPIEERVMPLVENIQVAAQQYPPIVPQVAQQMFVEPLPPDAYDVELAESPPLSTPTYSPPQYQSPEYEIEHIAAGGAQLYDAEPIDYVSPDVTPEYSPQYEPSASPMDEEFVQSVLEHEYTDRFNDVNKELMNRRLQIGRKAVRLRESQRPGLGLIAELPQYEEYVSPERQQTRRVVVPEQELIPGLAPPQLISPEQQAAHDFIEHISQPIFDLMDQRVDDDGLPSGILDPGMSLFSPPKQKPPPQQHYPAIYSPTDPFTYADLWDDSLDAIEPDEYYSPPPLATSPQLPDINQMAAPYGVQLDASPPPEFASPPQYSPEGGAFWGGSPPPWVFPTRVSPPLPELMQIRPQAVEVQLSERTRRMFEEQDARERQIQQQIQEERNRQMQSSGAGGSSGVQTRQTQPQGRRTRGPQVRLTRSAQLRQMQVQQQQQGGAQVRFGPPVRAVSQSGSRGPSTSSASQTSVGRGRGGGACPAARQGRCPGSQRSQTRVKSTTSIGRGRR